mgnify:CR=1 FL=1
MTDLTPREIVSELDRFIIGQKEAKRAVAQANALLADVRESLKKVDRVLADAQEVSGNAKDATKDLASLRAEVDASLRKVTGLIEEINRKWPFKREAEIKLP